MLQMELYLVIFGMLIIGSSGLSLQIFFRNQNSEAKPTSEKTLSYFRLLIPLGMLLAFGVYCSDYGSFTAPHWTLILGIGLYLLGMLLRWYAVWRLKHFFTVQLAIQKDHRLIQTGLFKYIRHPSYLGMLTYFLGLGLIMHNFLSLFIMLVFAWLAIRSRIRAEEKLLLLHFGEEYLQYQKSTKRLIPFIF